MINYKEIKIRKAKENDTQEVTNIEEDSFIKGEAWDYNSFYYEITSNKHSHLYVLTQNKVIIGFVLFYHLFELVDVVSIAIAKEKQGLGLGDYLLEFLINKSRKLGAEKIVLEVRKSNKRAINLYIKHKFEFSVVKQGYYYDGEDALVYQYNIIPEVL